MTIYDLGHNGNARHGDVQLLQEDEGQLLTLPERHGEVRVHRLLAGQITLEKNSDISNCLL